MDNSDLEIGKLVGKALRDSLQEGFERLERRLAAPVQNAQPAPTVISTGGGGQPVINVDTRALGEALGKAVAEALAPVLNELVEGREQVAQLVQAVAGIELRPTINVPEAAVHVELGNDGADEWVAEHDFEAKTSHFRRVRNVR